MSAAETTATNMHAKALAALMTFGADLGGALDGINVRFSRCGGTAIIAHRAPLDRVLTLLGLTGLTEATVVKGTARQRAGGSSVQWLSWGDYSTGGIEVVWFVDDADLAYLELHDALGAP